MNAICMEDKEGGVRWYWLFAKVTGMIELDFKPDGFQ